MGHVRIDLILSDIFVRLGPLWAIGSVVLLLLLCLLRLQRSFGVGLAFLMFLQVWITPLYYTCSRLRWWVIGILGVRSLLLLLASKPRPGESRTPHTILALLASWAVISTIWSRSPVFTFLVSATFVLGLIVSFVLVWRLADSVDVVGFICRWSVVVSLLLYGMSYVVSVWALVWNDARALHLTGFLSTRFSGIFGNPNGCGVLAATLLPFVFAAPREVLGGLSKVRLLTVILLVSAVLMSGSRSAFIGCLVALAVILLFRFRAGAAVFGGLVLATSATMMFATPVETLDQLDATAAGRVVRVSTLSDLGDRLELWEMGWENVKESPWIGSGWSISRVLDGRDITGALEAGRVRSGTNLHNAHLQILVDLGVVGLILFWIFGWQVAVACLRLINAPASRKNVVNIVLVASLAVMWGDSFVHGWIFSFGSPATLVFWACCGLVLKAADAQQQEDAGTVGRAAAALPRADSQLDPRRRPWPTPRHRQATT